MKKILVLASLILLFSISGCTFTSGSSKKTNKTNNGTTSVITNNKTTKVDSTNVTTTSSSNIDDKFVFDEEEYLRGLNERKQYLIDYCMSYTKWGDLRYSPGHAVLQFKQYERTGEEKYLNQALSAAESYLQSYEKGTSDCFSSCYINAFYILCNKYLSDDIKARYQTVIKNFAGYGYSSATQNHTLFAAVGRFLAEQEFPGEVTVNYKGYMNSDPTDKTGEKAIRNVLASYPKYGIYEYNSDTYFNCHLICLLVLALCAKDEEIKTKALMNFENGIFSLAPVYLDGLLCVGTGRTYNPYASRYFSGQTNILMWMYFGSSTDELPSKENLVFDEAASLAFELASDFVPNWISVMMARDRSEEYTHTELHYYPNGNSFAYMTTYMDNEFAVFNTKLTWPTANYSKSYGDCSLGKDKRYGGYKHRLGWGIRFIGEDPNYYETFSIQNLHSFDTSRDNPFGTSMNEQTFQYKSSVIGVFDIPSDYNYPGIVLYEPANYVAIIDESYLGRLYIHYGSVIIAFQLSQSFVNDIEETTYGDKVRCCNMTKGWFVCEAIDPSTIDEEDPMDQLYYVQSMLEGNFKNVKYDYTNNTYVEYKSIDGTIMSMNFGGDSQIANEKLDGELQVFNYKSFGVQNNPWVEQNWNDMIITYSYKGYSYKMDFEKGTVEYTEP